MTIIVNVKLYGGTHIARVLKWGITASCTSDSENAVRNAVKKFCARTGRDIDEADFKAVSKGVCMETWTVTWGVKL
jgi:hypothetical protein